MIREQDPGILEDTYSAVCSYSSDTHTMRNTQKKLQLRDVQDVIDVIGGRWRGAILASLCAGDKRFNDLRRDLGPITPHTLVKELRYLEESKLLSRSIDGASVTYSLTSHGHSLEPLIAAIVSWGQEHRKLVLGKS